jgi:hypothetical protein
MSKENKPLLAAAEVNKPPPGSSKKTNVALAAAALGSGAAIGTGVGAASAQQSSPDVQKDFAHLLIRDRPINSIPTMVMHNAGTEAGSGTFYVASNNSMGIAEALDKTPVRGFELDLHMHEGEIIVNHGGVVDVSGGRSLDDNLAPIGDWLNRPENKNQIVYLTIESKLKSQNNQQAFSILQNRFGSKIYTKAELESFSSTHNGRWPTADELTANGPRVVILDSLNGNVFPGYSFEEKNFSPSLEDRTIIGSLGSDINSQPDFLSTDDVDAAVKRGGIIKIDQVSENDPRFYRPEDRDKLALRPDISVGGLFYVSDTTATSALFGFGVGASSASGLFGLFNLFEQTRQNSKFLTYTKEHFGEVVSNLELGHILLARKARGILNPEELAKPVTADEIKALARDTLRQTITKRTIQPGAMVTLALSGSMLSLAMLFPPFFIIFAIMSLVFLATGTIATTAATIFNRNKLEKNSDAAEQDIAVHNAAISKSAELSAQIKDDSKNTNLDIEKYTSDPLLAHNLEKAGYVLAAGTVAARISSMAKYTMPLVGQVAWGVSSGIMAGGAALQSVKNYLDRQKLFKSPADLIKKLTLPNIHKSAFWPGSKSLFSNYIKDNRTALIAELDIPKHSNESLIKRYLAKPGSREIRQKHETECLKSALKIISDEHSKKLLNQPFSRLPSAQKKQVLHDLFINDVEKNIRYDVRKSGFVATVLTSIAISFWAILFPAALAAVIIAIVALIVISSVVTEAVARHEGSHAKRIAEDCLVLSEAPEKASDILQKKEALQMQKIIRSIEDSFIEEDKSKNSNDQKPPESKDKEKSEQNTQSPQAPRNTVQSNFRAIVNPSPVGSNTVEKFSLSASP